MYLVSLGKKIYVWFKVIVFSGGVNWEKQAVVNFLEKSNYWTEAAVWASEHFYSPGFVNFNLGFTRRSSLGRCKESISVATFYPRSLAQQITGSNLGEWRGLTQQEGVKEHVKRRTLPVVTYRCLHVFRTIRSVPSLSVTLPLFHRFKCWIALDKVISPLMYLSHLRVFNLLINKILHT